MRGQGSASSQGTTGPPAGVQQQRAQLRAIKVSWKQHGWKLSRWWPTVDKDDRLKFLLEWCPYMPLAIGKPYLYVDGKKEDVYGAAMMTPEINQKDLVEGDRLIEWIKQVAEVPDEDEPGGSPGYDAFEELSLRELPKAHTLVNSVESKLTAAERKSAIVLLMPGARFGQQLLVKKMVPDIKAWLEKGVAVPAPVFETLMLRLGTLLGSISMCLDHFRVEILGKKIYKAIGPQMGCAQCGAYVQKDTEEGRLMACGACGAVFYCSKECQKQHWREHKPDCKPQEQQQPQQEQEQAQKQEQPQQAAAAAATT